MIQVFFIKLRCDIASFGGWHAFTSRQTDQDLSITYRHSVVLACYRTEDGF